MQLVPAALDPGQQQKLAARGEPEAHVLAPHRQLLGLEHDIVALECTADSQGEQPVQHDPLHG